MARQQRKIVFFLGAGASLGAGAFAKVQHGRKLPIPIQSTFWEIFLRFCRSDDSRNEIQSFLFRYFLGYARVPARLKKEQRRIMLGKVDVEEVFTFLSERTRAPSTSPALKGYANKIWTALVSELPNVFGHYQPNKSTRSVYRQFIKNFIRSRDTIASFNYDTILEDSVLKSFKWHYQGITDATNSIGILKPHGSVNWEDSDPIRVEAVPSRALVIAPTHLKFVKSDSGTTQDTSGYLDHSPGIKNVWSVMEREMREAKALVFIGYSFPTADLYFSSVLRSVLADRDGPPGVAIVNPDAVAIRERLRQRFSFEHVGVYFDLKTFVSSSRRSLLIELGV